MEAPLALVRMNTLDLMTVFMTEFFLFPLFVSTLQTLPTVPMQRRAYPI